MHDSGEPFSKSAHPGQLFQLRIFDPSLAGDSRPRMSPVNTTSSFCQQRCERKKPRASCGNICVEIESGWKCIPPFVLPFPPLRAGLLHKVTHHSAMQQTGMLIPTQICPFSVRFSAVSAVVNFQSGI